MLTKTTVHLFDQKYSKIVTINLRNIKINIAYSIQINFWWQSWIFSSHYTRILCHMNLISWFGGQETFIIIDVKKHCA